jgi:hypothetical protein
MALTPPAPHATSVPSSTKPESSSNAPTLKRSRTQRAPNQVQDTVEVVDNRLSKYVTRDANLLTELGWEKVVRARRQRGDFGNLRIRHPAQRLLRYLRDC